MTNPDTPETLARVHARKAYHEACERLADASVRHHAALDEFNNAMAQYREALGAARGAGVATWEPTK